MNEEELIRRLRQLQIEENNIIEQLAAIRSGDEAINQSDDEVIRVGDTVKLLTKGVRSKKGDLAVVTSVSDNSIGIKLKNTGHITRRQPNNVKKVKANEK